MKTKKATVKNRSVQRWVIPSIVIVIAICLIVGFAYIYQMRQARHTRVNSAVSKMAKDVNANIGGKGSQQYNETLRKYEQEQSQIAEESGESRVSAVIGQVEANELIENVLEPEKKPEPKPVVKKVEKPKPSPQSTKANEEYQKQLAALQNAMENAVKQELATINNTLKQDMPVQKVTVFAARQASVEAAKQERKAQSFAEKTQNTVITTPFEVGEVVYCVNDIAVNSDVPGPVTATIVSGPLKGGKFIGAFTRYNDYLRLEFSSFSRDGETYDIRGYGVDPATSGVAVRTDADHHYFTRWGGLVAASFLRGFADAVEKAGITTTDTNYSSVQSYPEYDLSDQSWIAAGEVGETLAVPMQQHFYTPPTVTLDPMDTLGVLIIQN